MALSATLVGAPAVAQWLNYPNGPSPRTSDGHPDLSRLWEPVGPANFSFVGNSARDPQFADISKEVICGLPFQPRALILFERDTVYREILTAGRPLPEDPQPSLNVAASPRPFDPAASPRLLEIAVVGEWTNGN
jgi:hypothetical protein